MKDLVSEQVHQYLYQFYSSKNSDILLYELKKLIYKKDDEYKLDIFFIERILIGRGLSKEIDQSHIEVANNKVIHKIDLKGMINSYKHIFLKKNKLITIVSFGGTLLFLLLNLLITSDPVLLFVPTFFIGIPTSLVAIWIITEPLLSYLIIPLMQSILDTLNLILQGMTELTNGTSGQLKKWSVFYDREKDKPLIAKIQNLERVDIMLIESVFDKRELTENQAKVYLNSMLSIKNNISSSRM